MKWLCRSSDYEDLHHTQPLDPVVMAVLAPHHLENIHPLLLGSETSSDEYEIRYDLRRTAFHSLCRHGWYMVHNLSPSLLLQHSFQVGIKIINGLYQSCRLRYWEYEVIHSPQINCISLSLLSWMVYSPHLFTLTFTATCVLSRNKDNYWTLPIRTTILGIASNLAQTKNN